MTMKMDQINEFQLYLQMYDRGLVSKKTVLAKIGINWEDEQKEIEKDIDIEFDKKRYAHPTSLIGGGGGGGSQ